MQDIVIKTLVVMARNQANDDSPYSEGVFDGACDLLRALSPEMADHLINAARAQLDDTSAKDVLKETPHV